MKQNKPRYPMGLRRAIGSLLTSRRTLPLAAAALLLPAASAVATEIDLVTVYPSSGSFAAGTSPGGAGAIYSTKDTLPAGTGVFDPFLTYQGSPTEQGFNTSQGGSGQGFMDDKRVQQWTHDLHLNELAVTFIGGNPTPYYAFELDANEKGNGNNDHLLSIDDIRIYTSATDTATTVGDNAALVDSLGVLRYAQNAILGSTANFVLIDASKSEGGHTSGSGSSDMIVFIPTALFAGALPTDFVYFYTKNGAQNGTDGDTSEAGFEEWRSATEVVTIPDTGNTLALLGLGLLGLGCFAHRKTAKSA